MNLTINVKGNESDTFDLESNGLTQLGYEMGIEWLVSIEKLQNFSKLLGIYEYL